MIFPILRHYFFGTIHHLIFIRCCQLLDKQCVILFFFTVNKCARLSRHLKLKIRGKVYSAPSIIGVRRERTETSRCFSSESQFLSTQTLSEAYKQTREFL